MFCDEFAGNFCRVGAKIRLNVPDFATLEFSALHLLRTGDVIIRDDAQSRLDLNYPYRRGALRICSRMHSSSFTFLRNDAYSCTVTISRSVQLLGPFFPTALFSAPFISEVKGARAHSLKRGRRKRREIQCRRCRRQKKRIHCYA